MTEACRGCGLALENEAPVVLDYDGRCLACARLYIETLRVKEARETDAPPTTAMLNEQISKYKAALHSIVLNDDVDGYTRAIAAAALDGSRLELDMLISQKRKLPSHGAVLAAQYLDAFGHMPERSREEAHIALTILLSVVETPRSRDKTLIYSQKEWEARMLGVRADTIERCAQALDREAKQGRPQSDVDVLRRMARELRLTKDVPRMFLPPQSDEDCAFCGKPCDKYAANPGLWPVRLCHPDGTGLTRWHHHQCVVDRLFPRTNEVPMGLLQKLEWSGVDRLTGDACCPLCEYIDSQDRNHTPHCELAAALKKQRSDNPEVKNG